MGKIYDKIKKWKGNFQISKKRIMLSWGCVLLYLLGYRLIPKAYATAESNIKYWVIIDFFLCLLLMVKIRISESRAKTLAFILMILAPAISFYCVEHVLENEIVDMEFRVVLLNYLIYLGVYLAIYFISNSIRFSVSFGAILFVTVALVNSFVSEFKGNSIRMSDIFAVKTALNVAGGYDFTFTEAKSRIVLLTLSLLLIVWHINYKEKRLCKKIVQRIAIGGVCATLAVTVLNKNYIEKKDLKPDIWELKESAKMHGSLLDFAEGIPYLHVEKPSGYTSETAKQIEEKGAAKKVSGLQVQVNQKIKYPDIIVIMNESFSNLGNLGDLNLNEECMPYFDNLKDNVIRGNLSVPVLGGLTANTEFEFLTGFSNAFLPSGVIAFQNYVKQGTYNYSDCLKEQGYHSIFMHPFYKEGWNRDNVYKMFGFDEMYFFDDFLNRETEREQISDSSDYKDLIKRYKDAKKEDEKVFLFNVTMQNHGGYETNEIEKQIKILKPEGEFPKAEEYLSLIKKSDEAFEELITYFSKQENPVIICMFGDHLPTVEEELMEKLLMTSEDSDTEKTAKKYQTPFIIYTNYDIQEKEYENISANYLQVLLSEIAGVPLNSYQLYLENIYEKYPVVNQFGVKDEEGNWYSWEEAQQFQEIKDYQKVQYRNLFD